jgi:MoaA/NifB/PqqE/SkfB family radical SAM enzyme
VSLEGPDAATHDALTAVEGSFGRALRGIEAFQGAGNSVQTNTTLTQANVDAASAMPPSCAPSA